MKLFRSQFPGCPRSWNTHCSASSDTCQRRPVSNWSLQFPVPNLYPYFWKANKNKDESPSPKSDDNSKHIHCRLSLWQRCHLPNMSTSLPRQVLLLSCQTTESFTGTSVPFIANLQLAAQSNKVLKITFSNLYSSYPLH